MAKRMAVSKFKTLHVKGLGGRMKQATMTAERFGIPRNLLLAATSESMINAWRSGKPELLERRDGSKLTDTAKGSDCAKLREALKGIGVLATFRADSREANRRLQAIVGRVAKALKG